MEKITEFINYIISWIPIITTIAIIIAIKKEAKRRNKRKEELYYENMKNAYKEALREYNEEKEGN